jgi:hypothetical protein
VCVLALAALLANCSGGEGGEDVEAQARAVPMTQSAAARALRLPRMRLARVMQSQAGTAAATIRVRVVITGRVPPDTTVQARSVDPACTESFVDTAVVRNGDAIVGALVWLEGAGTVFSAVADGEHRPTVILEQCRLQPRVQLAAPGSTIQLVMRDARVEQLVVVPASIATPIDTVSFIADGQLVPIQHRTDSTGVLGVYAMRLPWARSFVAIAPTGLTAISDSAGAATFTVDRAAKKVTVRAWHPSLGVVAGSINPSDGGAEQTITLTYRR